jgi:hypothetical protein
VHRRAAPRHRPPRPRDRVRAPRLPQRAARDPAGVRRGDPGGGRDAAGRPLPQRPGRPRPPRQQSGDLAGARRWFTSFGCCDVREPLDDLVGLGLIEGDRT